MFIYYPENLLNDTQLCGKICRYLNVTINYYPYSAKIYQKILPNIINLVPTNCSLETSAFQCSNQRATNVLQRLREAIGRQFRIKSPNIIRTLILDSHNALQLYSRSLHILLNLFMNITWYLYNDLRCIGARLVEIYPGLLFKDIKKHYK